MVQDGPARRQELAVPRGGRSFGIDFFRSLANRQRRDLSDLAISEVIDDLREVSGLPAMLNVALGGFGECVHFWVSRLWRETQEQRLCRPPPMINGCGGQSNAARMTHGAAIKARPKSRGQCGRIRRAGPLTCTDGRPAGSRRSARWPTTGSHAASQSHPRSVRG